MDPTTDGLHLLDLAAYEQRRLAGRVRRDPGPRPRPRARYLVAAEGRRVFLQRRGCGHRWWHDTG